VSDDYYELLLDEIQQDLDLDAAQEMLIYSVRNGTDVPDMPDAEYERLRREHYYPERAAAIARLGKRLRNTHAVLCKWDYVDLVSLERVLVAMVEGTTGELKDTAEPGHWSEREILGMVRHDLLRIPVPRPARKPRHSHPANERGPQRTDRRERRPHPDLCLANRLAAHAPPSRTEARNAMRAPGLLENRLAIGPP
jgi:hypothetical protein